MHIRCAMPSCISPAFVASSPATLLTNRHRADGVCHHTSPRNLARQLRATRQPHRGAQMREQDPVATGELGIPQVLCFGELLYDLMSRTPTASHTDLSEWDAHIGGAPSNVAACLVALRTTTALLANVGSDEAGQQLRAAMCARGVNVHGVLTLSRVATRRILVRRDGRGERAFVGFVGDNDAFADAMYLQADDVPTVLFDTARLFVCGTLALAFPGSARSARQLTTLARDRHLCVVVDVNWRPMIWAAWDTRDAREHILHLVRQADVVKASLEDIDMLLGPDAAAAALDDPGAVLRELGGGVRRGVLVTGGAQGVAYAFRGNDGVFCGRMHAVVSAAGVVDTTGAGDAFLAAFVSQLLMEGGEAMLSDDVVIERIVRFAVRVAGVTIGGNGAVGLLESREQVDQVVGDMVG